MGKDRGTPDEGTDRVLNGSVTVAEVYGVSNVREHLAVALAR